MEENASDSAASDSSSNFALRRAGTLDNFLVRDDDSGHDDASYVLSEGSNYDEDDEDGDREEDEEEDDEYDQDENGDEGRDDLDIIRLRLKYMKEDMKILERRLCAASLG
jgi:hypothetical protein